MEIPTVGFLRSEILLSNLEVEEDCEISSLLDYPIRFEYVLSLFSYSFIILRTDGLTNGAEKKYPAFTIAEPGDF